MTNKYFSGKIITEINMKGSGRVIELEENTRLLQNLENKISNLGDSL